MTTPDLTTLDGSLPMIRRSEVVDRIAELERRKAAAEAEGEPFDDADAEELAALVDLDTACVELAGPRWARIVSADTYPCYSEDLVAFGGSVYLLQT